MGKSRYLILFSLAVFSLVLFADLGQQKSQNYSPRQENLASNGNPKNPMPNDHWNDMRSYPYPFDPEQYKMAMLEVREDKAFTASIKAADLTLPWLEEGPGNIGGRFNCLEQDPTDPDIIYAGASNGGIFKTTDGGLNWFPIFDDYAWLAIGEIKVDPSDPDRIWVGTGDRNFGGGSHIGNGVYLSTDAGLNWVQMGLEETGIITEIHIDPTDPDRIYVGTLGNPYEKTNDRGVYLTTDGGGIWTQSKFVSDSSGVCDMAIDPSDPDIVYACFYNRINQPFNPKVAGPDAGIWKTINGGGSWVQLGGGLPLTENSRVGIEIVPSTPSHLYATFIDGITLNPIDIYESLNGGSTWTPLDVYSGGFPLDDGCMGGFGWYFGQIHVNPYSENQLMVQGVEQWASDDGGANWYLNVPEWWTYDVHADKHDILYLDSDSYIIATDGGLYKTDDAGSFWYDIENIAVSQFYHVCIDPFNDGLYGGGCQDNGSMSGNASVFNNWTRLFGGDGFRQKWMELEPDGEFFQVQSGGLYHNNDFTTGLTTISPTVFDPDRVNWDMPYVLNEPDAELFVGTSFVSIMEGAPFGFYTQISPDLTKVATGTYVGDYTRHTISEIEQDHFNNGYLYAGTTDGKVWRGEGSGAVWNWDDITGLLPDRYVTTLRASPNNEGTLFAGFSGYTINDNSAYLYMSIDYGDTWVDIGADLPPMPVLDILVVPGYEDEKLFVAIDGGVYYSEDFGANWNYVGVGMPACTVTELDVDIPNKKLIAGTYSRSMWSYDVSWLDSLSGPPSGAELTSAATKNIQMYPNPVTDLLYFKGLDDDIVTIYDQNGRKISDEKVMNYGNYQEINLSNLSSGTYILLADNKRRKIIKQ